MAGMLGAFGGFGRYALCDRPVTVYREEGGKVSRTVYPRAYMELGESVDVGREGASGSGSLLLVVPGGSDACRVGDRVMRGEGPEVPEDGVAAWWRSFIPPKVEGLRVVRSTSCFEWDGRAAHVEARG